MLTLSRYNLQIKHGKYEILDVYFGTPHSRSGSLYHLSTITVNGSMKLTFHPASPIVSKETNSQFADAFVDLLVNTANEKRDKALDSENFLSNMSIPEGSLSLAAAAIGVVGVAIHAGAWSEFFSNLALMKENVQVRSARWTLLRQMKQTLS